MAKENWRQQHHDLGPLEWTSLVGGRFYDVPLVTLEVIFLCCFLFLLARAARLEQQTSPTTRQTETVKMIRQTETSVRLRAGRPALSGGVGGQRLVEVEI